MTSVTRVRAILLVSVFLFASFIAWYILRSRFRSFRAHVVVWVRHDGFPEEGQPPEYALYLRGAKPAEIQFAGDKLNHRYVGACTCYQMYGVGDLLWHSNTIHIGDGSV